MLSGFHILAVSHKEVPLDHLPLYGISHTDESDLSARLHQLKEEHQLDELFYLATCNRILFLFHTNQEVDQRIISSFFPDATDYEAILSLNASKAVMYFLQVASSIHSMVVGEREILKQIKDTYELQSGWNLTADNIRLLVQHTIRSAKKVYTTTKIGEKPVSIVSLAVQRLLQKSIGTHNKFLIVGAGSTIQLVLKHLTKKGFNNFSIYNRTLAKAEALASSLSGSVGTLEDLEGHSLDFDAVIACTGATEPTITHDLANQLTGGQIESRIWVDLGMPPDIDSDIAATAGDNYIDIPSLQALASSNIRLRQKEVQKAESTLLDALEAFEDLIYERRIEKAFRTIPTEIKTIKERAFAEVFRKDLESIDADTHSLITKMMDYMEKKCIGIPMKAAKEAAIQR